MLRGTAVTMVQPFPILDEAAMILKKILLLLVVTTQLAACVTTRYEYDQPQSPEGRICAAQCLNSKQQCETMASMAYNQCQQNYRMAQHLYNECRKNNKKSHYCASPTYCYNERDNCKSNYDLCFQACGGHIRVIEEEM